jgi:3-isopropylmalate/(R)-2-methylmalate dehydratase small subunit
MKAFGGKVLFLDRSDINTDEIIPAKYLTEATKAALKPYCLEDLKLPDFEAARDLPGKAAILTRANFGCGSSREHAPWALEVNGINVVIAQNYARIFRQNMFNCGMLAIELPASDIDELFASFKGTEAECSVDFGARKLVMSGKGKKVEKRFEIAPFDAALVEAGGWVGYADAKY